MPNIRKRILGKMGVSSDAFRISVAELAQSSDRRVAVTGISSSSRYSVMAREPRLVLYCSELALGIQAVSLDQTSRFPDLELRVTDDPTVYFDLRNEGLPWASPIQAYLELKHGDPREQDTADQVRQRILDEAQGQTQDEDRTE